MRLNIYILFLAGSILSSHIMHGQQTSTSSDNATDYEAVYEANTVMKVGAVVPDFTLPMLNGEQFKLSDHKGKTVFINFFGLRCPICLKELPELEKQIWRKYRDNKELVILTIGREETIEKLSAFRDKKGYTFPIASDEDRAVYAMFAKMYIPRNIIIDKEGKLVFTEVGFNDEKFAKLIKEIDKQIRK